MIRRGFSLVELLIAAFLCTAIIGTITYILRGNDRRTALTGNSLIGTQVFLKVVNDLREEARVQPVLLPVLDEFPEMRTRGKVVCGDSTYFRQVIDRAPPWGRIEPATDGAIDESDGMLFSALEPFSVQVAADRLGAPTSPGPERHLARMVVAVDWKERQGPERRFALDFWLPSPTGPTPVPTEKLVDPALLPELVTGMFYPGKVGKPLSAAASEDGADPGLVQDLGEVAVTTRTLEALLNVSGKELSESRLKRAFLLGNPSPNLLRIQLGIARKCEGIAGRIFQTLRQLSPTMTRIRQVFPGGRLGSLPPQAAVFGLAQYRVLVAQVPLWVKQAGLEFEWMLDDSFRLVRSRRDEEFVRQKTIEAWRLLGQLVPAERTRFIAFLTRQKELMEGANPAWQKLFSREMGLQNDSTRIRLAYPNLGAILEEYENRLVPNARLAQELAGGGP